MSLQDDYFELSETLKDHQLECLERIWRAFVDMENEHEKLLQIRGAFRQMVEITFPQKEGEHER